jgi:hypothetical protein
MKKLPRSIRKFIRKEKARIRREILDLKKQEEEIKKLYEKFACKKRSLAFGSPNAKAPMRIKYEDKRNIRSSNKKGD